jgi:hypothetical protein
MNCKAAQPCDEIERAARAACQYALNDAWLRANLSTTQRLQARGDSVGGRQAGPG